MNAFEDFEKLLKVPPPKKFAPKVVDPFEVNKNKRISVGAT